MFDKNTHYVNPLAPLDEIPLLQLDESNVIPDDGEVYVENTPTFTVEQLMIDTDTTQSDDNNDHPHDDGDHSSLVQAEASPVLLNHIGRNSLWMNSICSDTAYASSPEYRWAELIYVKLIKESRDTPTGLVIQGHLGYISICRIVPDSLFGKTSLLEAGDRIIAVNGCSCRDMTPDDVSTMVRLSNDAVSILIQNKGGNPNIVSSTVQKPTVDSRIGVGVAGKNGSLIARTVHENGLFDGSLLVPGDRIVEINGQESLNYTPQEAAAILMTSTNLVTIISQPRGREFATVLCCETTVKQISHKFVLV